MSKYLNYLRFCLNATYFRSLVFKVIVRIVPIQYTDFIKLIERENVNLTKPNQIPKISCIVTCNDVSRLPFLKEALRSIQNQNYEKLQVIVVDGFGGLQSKLIDQGENYDSNFIFKEFSSKSPSEARNACLDQLEGDIVIFLDDDNIYLPGYFVDLANWHILNPVVDVAIFRFVLFKDNYLLDLPISRSFTEKGLNRRNLSDTSALSFKANIITKEFWPNAKHHEDWELLKICKSLGFRIEINNSFSMLYRVHSTNRSTPTSIGNLFKR